MEKFRRTFYSYFILFILCLFMAGCKAAGTDSCFIKDMTVNYCTNPLAVDENPIFSWKMEDTSTQGQYQTAYEITVADSKENLKKRQYVWDSGKVESGLSVALPYEGEQLQPETRYYWQVAVWDKDGKQIVSEQEAFFETGVSEEGWSSAEWICLPKEEKKQVSESEYIIEYDIRFDAPSFSGFLWAADEGIYGKYYMCAVDTTGDEPLLVIAEKEYEEVLWESSFHLGEVGFEIERSHHIMIEVIQGAATVMLDGQLIAQQELTELRGISSVGFWTQRGAYYAYYDNILVKSNDGEIWYQEDFTETGANIFSPYYLKTENGWAQASSGFIVTPGNENPAPMFRKEFLADAEIAEARLYASALGIYELYLNGQKVGEDYFSPGQSMYYKNVYYRAYDVTKQIQKGANAVGVILGSGRYNKAKGTWGDTLAFKGKLVITYVDGRKEYVVSDTSWTCYGNGPVRNDDMFMGEYYDANYEVDGWTEIGFAENAWYKILWNNAQVYEDVQGNLSASYSEPVRCVQEIAPVCVTEPIQDIYVYDFGQNINGVCRIKVTGQKGQVITLRYAETLNEETMSCRDDEIGTIWTQNLYMADNTDYYVLKGNDEEIFVPSLVSRGFRYVQISGAREALPSENVVAMVLSSDLERTGYFECSDEMVNQLYRNIYWSQQSNFVDIPTDCPQRDERFGWAGDAQVFEPTAAYNANVYQFMRQYVSALRLGQNENGSYPELAPSVSTDGGANGWSDAGIILVWQLYQQYGDVSIIKENLDAMCRYMDYLTHTSEGFLRARSGYNDHNAVSSLDDTLSNTAHCAYVASLLAKMCRIVEEYSLAEKYESVHEQYKSAWQKQYINEDGSIDCWLQSAYVLGLAFGLYPEELEEKGAACLNSAVAYNDYHLNTGYVATPYLMQTLCDYGYSDAAYRILQQKDYPSWGYMIAHGATTITEAWSTFYENEDETYGINGSLNHYGLGSVGKWMYEGILGIRMDETQPAYKHFYLEPVVGGGLTYAKGSYESIYGTIVSEWRIEGEEMVFYFEIPANTSATLTLPDPQYQNLELQAGKYCCRITSREDG